ALNRSADQVSPFRPGAVVILHVGDAKQVLQHEPGMAGALTDPAVGDHRLGFIHALGAVELLEFVVALECAVVVTCLTPRHAARAWNMAPALAGLGQSWGCQ